MSGSDESRVAMLVTVVCERRMPEHCDVFEGVVLDAELAECDRLALVERLKAHQERTQEREQPASLLSPQENSLMESEDSSPDAPAECAHLGNGYRSPLKDVQTKAAAAAAVRRLRRSPCVVHSDHVRLPHGAWAHQMRALVGVGVGVGDVLSITDCRENQVLGDLVPRISIASAKHWLHTKKTACRRVEKPMRQKLGELATDVEKGTMDPANAVFLAALQLVQMCPGRAHVVRETALAALPELVFWMAQLLDETALALLAERDWRRHSSECRTREEAFPRLVMLSEVLGVGLSQVLVPSPFSDTVRDQWITREGYRLIVRSFENMNVANVLPPGRYRDLETLHTQLYPHDLDVCGALPPGFQADALREWFEAGGLALPGAHLLTRHAPSAALFRDAPPPARMDQLIDRLSHGVYAHRWQVCAAVNTAVVLTRIAAAVRAVPCGLLWPYASAGARRGILPDMAEAIATCAIVVCPMSMPRARTHPDLCRLIEHTDTTVLVTNLSDYADLRQRCGPRATVAMLAPLNWRQRPRSTARMHGVLDAALMDADAGLATFKTAPDAIHITPATPLRNTVVVWGAHFVGLNQMLVLLRACAHRTLVLVGEPGIEGTPIIDLQGPFDALAVHALRGVADRLPLPPSPPPDPLLALAAGTDSAVALHTAVRHAWEDVLGQEDMMHASTADFDAAVARLTTGTLPPLCTHGPAAVHVHLGAAVERPRDDTMRWAPAWFGLGTVRVAGVSDLAVAHDMASALLDAADQAQGIRDALTLSVLVVSKSAVDEVRKVWKLRAQDTVTVRRSLQTVRLHKAWVGEPATAPELYLPPAAAGGIEPMVLHARGRDVMRTGPVVPLELSARTPTDITVLVLRAPDGTRIAGPTRALLATAAAATRRCLIVAGASEDALRPLLCTPSEAPANADGLSPVSKYMALPFLRGAMAAARDHYVSAEEMATAGTYDVARRSESDSDSDSDSDVEMGEAMPLVSEEEMEEDGDEESVEGDICSEDA